jgi:hypothetical protein
MALLFSSDPLSAINLCLTTQPTLSHSLKLSFSCPYILVSYGLVLNCSLFIFGYNCSLRKSLLEIIYKARCLGKHSKNCKNGLCLQKTYAVIEDTRTFIIMPIIIPFTENVLCSRYFMS